MKQAEEKVQEAEERIKEREEKAKETEERVIIIDEECQQMIKDLKMAHTRDIAKLTRDMRDNYQKKID